MYFLLRYFELSFNLQLILTSSMNCLVIFGNIERNFSILSRRRSKIRDNKNSRGENFRNDRVNRNICPTFEVQLSPTANTYKTAVEHIRQEDRYSLWDEGFED